MATLITRQLLRVYLTGPNRSLLSKTTVVASYSHNFSSNKSLEGNIPNQIYLKQTITADLLKRYNVGNMNANYSTEKVGSVAEESDAGKLKSEVEKPKELSRKEKLKLAVKEYGSTVIVFHVAISLTSLGICYLAVSSGVDVAAMLSYLGFGEEGGSKLAATSGTFVAAYAIHKLFAPVRISITLGATPFIVRYLRHKGWIKRR